MVMRPEYVACRAAQAALVWEYAVEGGEIVEGERVSS
jgi:hypothetical protein